MGTHQFSFPTAIYFGAGVSKQVKDFLKDRGFRKPLVVTDKGVVGLSFFKNFLNSLGPELNVSVFSEIWGNPVETQVKNGVVAYKEHGADCLVGIGGGAALDVAKVIALMSTHSGSLFDYEDIPGAKPIEDKVPFWIALPTTSGTGSEVGRSSVISDEKTHIKRIVYSPLLLAKAVFADPELTFDLPEKITAATGMDALTHCVEAFLAKAYHPICDGIALEGIRLASLSLVRCVNNPIDLEARSQMMMSSMMGAIAFQKGLGLVHSCAHSLSAVLDMHHGLANGIMIDHALKFNVSAVPERFSRMAQTVGLARANPESFIQWLTELKSEVGVLEKLPQGKDKIEQLSKLAFEDGCHQNNPRPCRREDFEKIFAEAT
ncbi:MAG: iron-containing alcohol dehydrogenase [Bacteriovoracia bacterium]